MMKFRLLLLPLLLIPLVYAQIDFQKISYDISETIQAEIIFDKLAENIKIENMQITDLQGNKQPIQINLLKINESHYYLFFEMNNQGNYVLNVKDIKYKEYGILKQISLTKTFEITNQEKDISINPAVFKYERGLPSFTLKIRNNQQQAKIVLLSSNHTSLEFQDSIPIPGRTEQTATIKLNIENEKNKKIEFMINDYAVPIYITPKEQIAGIEISLNNNIITRLTREIKEKTTTQGTLSIKNNFNKEKQFDLRLTSDLSQVLRISKNKLTIGANKQEDLELYINEGKSPQKESYKGNLEFTAQDYKKILPIELIISPASLEVNHQLDEEIPDEIIGQEQSEEQEPEKPYENEEEIIESEQTRTGLILAITLITILVLIIFFVIRKPIKSTPEKIKDFLGPKN